MRFSAQNLDTSVAEFILSGAEGLFRNDMGRFEAVKIYEKRRLGRFNQEGGIGVDGRRLVHGF